MTINFSIGKLILKPQDPKNCSYIHLNVEEIFDNKAPFEGKNEIALSYSAFDDFIEITGLRKYFSDEIVIDSDKEYGVFDLSLMQDKSGVSLITEHHIKEFRKRKMESLTLSYPKFCIEVLDWLIFWSSYAVKNYEQPIFCHY